MDDTFPQIHEYDREVQEALKLQGPTLYIQFHQEMESNGKLPLLDTCIFIKISH